MYQALYRKWRPMSFDDVVSQPHVTTTLKNQIKNGKTAHAYLFTGSRGTGKTTCARIFAKAVNCENPHDGEPCLDCKICKAADNGTLADIIEIDAASNSKVDDIRELREGVIYTPEMCKYKVYIIDEVHMLSPGAFNALLKTMEEPPEHVKFILATTEIHKVPSTIVSRCQHFDFHRIRTEDIVDRLSFIAKQEGFTLEQDAAALIARLSDGGMRDALSLLDQCVAYDDHITLEVVSGAAGIAGRDHLFDIIENIADKDAASALKVVDRLYSMSKDLKVLANELLVQMRNVMLVKTVDNSKELVICLPDEYERLQKIADKLRLEDILRDISVLQECSERFARCTSKRVEMEMTIIKLCSEITASNQPESQPQAAAAPSVEVSGLLKRIASLESKLSAAGQAAQSPQQTPQAPPKQYDPELQKLSADNDGPLKQWNDIVVKIRERSPAIGSFLKDSVAFIKGNSLFLIVQSDIYLKKFKASSSDAAIINEVLSEMYGQTFNIRVKSAKKAEPDDAQDPTNQLISKARELGIEVEIKN